MKIESVEALIDWTRAVHVRLAQALALGAQQHSDEHTVNLLEYLHKHEVRLGTLVTAFEAQADPKALNTFVYDYVVHSPVDVDRLCDKAFDRMSAEDITDDVLATHNEVIALYRSLLNSSVIPEEQELLEELLKLLDHETRLLAQQASRGMEL